MLDAANSTDVQAETLLEVNNIEVIYNHVILVLKGVSLNVPKAASPHCWVATSGQDHDTTAISNLLHSERGEVTKAPSAIVVRMSTNRTPQSW